MEKTMTELTEEQKKRSVPPQTPEEWAGYANVIYADHDKEELEALLPWLEERVRRLAANGTQRLRDRAAAGVAEVKRRLAEFEAGEGGADSDD